MNKVYMRIGVAFGLLILLSAAIWITDADLRIARLLFKDGFMYDGKFRWPGWGTFPWQVIYDFATVPAIVLSGLSLIVLAAGFFVRPLNVYRRQALFLVLLIAIGPGLLINVLLKDNYGRARPRQLVEFGGEYQYTEIWQMGESGKNSSFPSGHSSIGFYMMAPWFLLPRNKKAQAFLWLAGGIGFGLLIGWARIMQGGHFPSDVVWAGGLIYITGELLYAVVFRNDLQQVTT